MFDFYYLNPSYITFYFDTSGFSVSYETFQPLGGLRGKPSLMTTDVVFTLADRSFRGWFIDYIVNTEGL